MKPGSVILVPTYNNIEHETEASLQALEKRGWEVWRQHGLSSVDLARSIMASRAYLAGYDWIYWIDSDMLFEPSDFEKLAAWNEPFCCAPYAMKGSGGRLAIEYPTTSSSNEHIIKVSAAGFGFMKTHRLIYDAMSRSLPTCFNYERPMFPFFQPGVWEKNGQKVFYGEDYNFCFKAREAGFELYADFSIKIGHIGRWAFMVDNPL